MNMSPLYYPREVRTMRKTITGTGGMLLLQTLKDAGVEYLFTNPGSAETGIFAALSESGEQRLVVGKHEGLVAAMADGYHRLSGKVGVVIAHVMGGSWQLAGQLFNAQHAGSALLVVAGDWASELQDYRGLAPHPGLSQAETMRAITKDARAAYTVVAEPKAIPVATARALREATTAPTCGAAARKLRPSGSPSSWTRRCLRRARCSSTSRTGIRCIAACTPSPP